ncbi:MAG TPA: hypothetical protein VLT79_06390 [Gemmatimonadales bacterium]|nr:hypothetical protein [Gemmatimonadales bacterium]
MDTVFHIVPAGVGPLYFLVPIFPLLAFVVGLLGMTAYGSQRERFVLSDAGLDFRGDIYGRRVPWSALRVQDARVVDLAREAALRPRSRQRALVFLTARHRALYVPTTAGYVLFLSPDYPEAMLAELRRRSG